MIKVFVIFRKFEDEVTALFPLELGSNDPYDFLCYSSIGQHGIANRLWARETKPAKPYECRELARELRQIGYKLKVGKRIPRNSLEVRRKKLVESDKVIIR